MLPRNFVLLIDFNQPILINLIIKLLFRHMADIAMQERPHTINGKVVDPKRAIPRELMQVKFECFRKIMFQRVLPFKM
jgi:hypothetical protein